MQFRIRTYKLKPGTQREFIDKWQEDLVPLRRELGFEVEWAYYSAETSEFIWLVSYAGEGPYENAEEKYYASPQRAAISWDARDYIAEMNIRSVDKVF